MLVTAGRGYYREYGEEPRELNPGDVVNIMPGIKHWHSAAQNEVFQHLAIEVPAENGYTEWCELLSDKEYCGLK